jgi:hypothetical protein
MSTVPTPPADPVERMRRHQDRLHGCGAEIYGLGHLRGVLAYGTDVQMRAAVADVLAALDELAAERRAAQQRLIVEMTATMPEGASADAGAACADEGSDRPARA